MLCVAAVSALVLHAAVLLLPLPASATALQPLIELLPSLKLTLPVGLLPVTVAVNVTFAPATDGLAELVNSVVVGAAVTVTVAAFDVPVAPALSVARAVST